MEKALKSASRVEQSPDFARGTRVKPRLLQLCAVDYTAYYLLRPLARALRDEYEVHFASSPGRLATEIQKEGFAYHQIPIERSYNIIAHIRSAWLLTRLMKREKYQIVHTHTPIASLIGRLAARLAGVPIVLYTAHGFYFHERMRPLARRVFVWLEKIGGRFTDFTFTQSKEDCVAAVALGISQRDRVLHIGNGVDLLRFDPKRLSGQRDTVRQSLGIDPQELVVSVVGRLVREKGYLELVDAFARVAERFPDAQLVIVGSTLESAHDDVSVDVRRTIDRHGLAGRVHLLSPEIPVEHVLVASDVYTLPSYREGLPRSILEAMAMGLPVVATNIRGSREVVTHGATGTLVEVGDVDELAGALVDLLADPGRRQAYGQRAQAIANKEFDEHRIIDTQCQVLRRLCADKGIATG
jgi:glycosyltransferase involved in cell wall biosynthesis